MGRALGQRSARRRGRDRSWRGSEGRDRGKHRAEGGAWMGRGKRHGLVGEGKLTAAGFIVTMCMHIPKPTCTFFNIKKKKKRLRKKTLKKEKRLRKKRKEKKTKNKGMKITKDLKSFNQSVNLCKPGPWPGRPAGSAFDRYWWWWVDA